jgi:hypothetical protein
VRGLTKYYKIRRAALFCFSIIGTGTCHSAFVKVNVNITAALFAKVLPLFPIEAEIKNMLNVSYLQESLLKAICDFSFDALDPDAEKIVETLISSKKFKIGTRDLTEVFQKSHKEFEKMWEKKAKFLEGKKYEIECAYRECDLDFLLQRIRAFFGSTRFLGENVPFEIFLFPSWNDQFGFAFPIGSHFIFLQALREDSVSHIAIIMHEICHIFYHCSSIHQRHLRQDFFGRGRSFHKALAKNYLDEALATSIGNQLIPKRLRGKHDEKTYDNEYIDKYARELLPLIEHYLDNNIEMDKSFLEKSVEIFNQAFPNATRDCEALFFAPTIFSDFMDDEIIPLVRNAFASGEVHVFTTKEYQKIKTRMFPVVIFIVKNSQKLPGIWRPKQTDFLYVKKDFGKKQSLVVISTDSLKKIEKALIFLKKMRTIDASFLYNL